MVLLENLYDTPFQVRDDLFEKPRVGLQPAVIARAWVWQRQIRRREFLPALDCLGQRRFDAFPQTVILRVTTDDQR